MLRLFRCLSLHVLCALCGLLFLNACRSYVPAPVDWAREAADWSATATNRTPLTLAEARQLALILNPEINAFRLSRLSSDRLALASGWWEDPAIDLDGLRLLKGGPHPLILGGGLTFTLPVNGVPGIEKRAAQAYARADALAVTVAEQRLLDHRLVARLEDVQRQRHPRKEDDVQRKERQFVHSRILVAYTHSIADSLPGKELLRAWHFLECLALSCATPQEGATHFRKCDAPAEESATHLLWCVALSSNLCYGAQEP